MAKKAKRGRPAKAAKAGNQWRRTNRQPAKRARVPVLPQNVPFSELRKEVDRVHALRSAAAASGNYRILVYPIGAPDDDPPRLLDISTPLNGPQGMRHPGEDQAPAVASALRQVADWLSGDLG